jgi:hypothetical protein
MAIPSRQIGWGTESNLLWQILKQLNKLTSVLFGLKEAATPNYKVFTALLTQSGASSPDVLSGGDLIIGRTYRIKDTGSGFDFTNVGAPNNDYGTWFVATGTTPTSWADGQLIYDIGAPTAIVLENTIGNIWFEYSSAGTYICRSNDLFTIDKTTVFISDTVNTKSSTDPLQMRVLCSLDKNVQPGYLVIYTGTVSISYEDNIICNDGGDQYAVTFEIRVYN